ncbi:MAG: hypothetical protein LIO87_07425, partial [Eubacterium sp.]|nr:hypothetical protein [Eubacterium sp.]
IKPTEIISSEVLFMRGAQHFSVKLFFITLNHHSLIKVYYFFVTKSTDLLYYTKKYYKKIAEVS